MFLLGIEIRLFVLYKAHNIIMYNALQYFIQNYFRLRYWRWHALTLNRKRCTYVKKIKILKNSKKLAFSYIQKCSNF